MTWTPEDAAQLVGIRVALRDIADALMEQTADKRRRDGSCPECGSREVHDAESFGATRKQHVCPDCEHQWGGAALKRDAPEAAGEAAPAVLPGQTSIGWGVVIPDDVVGTAPVDPEAAA